MHSGYNLHQYKYATTNAHHLAASASQPTRPRAASPRQTPVRRTRNQTQCMRESLTATRTCAVGSQHKCILETYVLHSPSHHTEQHICS